MMGIISEGDYQQKGDITSPSLTEMADRWRWDVFSFLEFDLDIGNLVQCKLCLIVWISYIKYVCIYIHLDVLCNLHYNL